MRRGNGESPRLTPDGRGGDAMNDITEYDEHGNEIHTRDSAGFEQWREYDKNGNEILIRNSDGYVQITPKATR